LYLNWIEEAVGGMMRTKALVIKRKKTTGRIMAAALMLVSIWVILAFALQAYGAGAPKASTKKSKSAAEKRAEANTYFDKGKRFQDKENYKEAARQYEKAVKADPNYAEAHSNLGYSYRKQGKFNQAVRSYKKAVSLDPKLAEAHEYLGEAYAEMGKFELAEKELQILRDLGSDEADELAEFINKKKSGE
jgi:tetratricopeptide (TPR) repeat protein